MHNPAILTTTRTWASNVALTATLLILSVACGSGGDDDGSGPPPPPPSAFQVDSVAPAATSSQLWPRVRIYFSDPPDPVTVSNANVILARGAETIPILLSAGPDAKTALLDAPLVPGVTYSVNLSAGVKDQDGEALEAYSGTFATPAAQPLAVAPLVNGSVQRILLGGAGKALLLSLDGFAGKLWYSECAGSCRLAGSWQTVSIDDSASGTAIAAERNDAVVIRVLYSGPSTRLRYAECSASCASAAQWTRTTIDTTSKSGNFVSMTQDAGGTLHALAANWTDGKLHYLTCAAGCTLPMNWNQTSLSGTDLNEQDLAIAVGPADVIHAVYRGQQVPAGTQALTYLTCATSCTTGGNWTGTPLETWGTGSSGSALLVDGTGRLHHSYMMGTGQVYYSTCVTLCASAASWTRTTVYNTNSGNVTALAFGPSGRMAVAFGGPTGNLWLATCLTSCMTGSNWRQNAVMPAVNSGLFPSLAFDAEGQPRIATGVIDGQYIE